MAVTTPVPPVPDDESIAYEAAAVVAVVGPVAAAVAAALAVAGVAVATGTIVGAGAVALGYAVAKRLREVPVPDMSLPLSMRVSGAVDLGVRTAMDSLPPRDRPDTVDKRVPDTRTDLRDTVRTKLSEAADIAEATGLASKSDLDKVTGRANTGLAQARGAVRFAVNHAINSGTADVATAAGKRLIWVAERNACLHCLAYAGWATEPGEPFPHGLTYDPAGPLRPFGDLLWPPLHPNCRCRVALYDGPAGAPVVVRSRVDPASRLASEAQRSVIYQWSDYASGAAARRAATALLDQGTALADSVERRARAALKRGAQVRRPK